VRNEARGEGCPGRYTAGCTVEPRGVPRGTPTPHHQTPSKNQKFGATHGDEGSPASRCARKTLREQCEGGGLNPLGQATAQPPPRPIATPARVAQPPQRPIATPSSKWTKHPVRFPLEPEKVCPSIYVPPAHLLPLFVAVAWPCS
jgi:hypothetical protein